jgi:hypothetical protein
VKKLSNFKLFESKEPYIDYPTIRDLFIELIDNGYEMNKYDNYLSKIGKYFFEFKKRFTEDELGFFDKDHAYGYSNLDKIKSEINSSISIIEESSNRLKDMGYTIGFEIEFNFSSGSLMCIVCHMHHSKYDDDNINI